MITKKELWISIKKALTKEEYDIFWLYHHGYTQEEIAEKYHCDQRTIRRCIKRIKEILRQVL